MKRLFLSLFVLLSTVPAYSLVRVSGKADVGSQSFLSPALLPYKATRVCNGAQITLYYTGTTTKPPTFNSNGTARANPISADGNGDWYFYTDHPSVFDALVEGCGFTRTIVGIPSAVAGSDYINAADYGVVCDGVTDDTVELQNSINAATALGGLKQFITVGIPNGQCLLSPQGANAYAIDVPPDYAPNGSLGTIVLQGAGGGTTLVIDGTYNLGTTLKMTSTANKPVLRVNGGRDVVVRDLNIDGSSIVASSVGASVYNFNSHITFKKVGFNNFADLARIGDPSLADGGSSNNDLVTFSSCVFSSGTVGVAIYGYNSYGVLINDNSFFSSNVATGVKYFPDPAGSGLSNNDIKIHNSQFLVTDSVLWSSGTATSRLGIAEIVGCTIEPAAGNGLIRIHRQDNVFAGNAHGLVITNNTINMSGLDATHFANAAIEYYGRGPFRFTDNYIDSYRFEVLLGTFQNSANSSAIVIGNNWLRSRLILRYPVGNPYPAVTILPNVWQYLPKRNTTDALIDAASGSEDAILRKGIGTYSALDTNTSVSYRAGSIIITSTGIRTVTASGTYGTLTAVTGSITAGTNTLTLDGGATGERAKITNGSFITIAGCAGSYEVDNIVNETVTLQSNCAAGAATAAVQFQAPTISAAGIP